MKSKLISLIFPFNKKAKNILNFSIMSLLLFFCFSIPTFSNRYPYNYISIITSILLIGCIAVFVILYGRWKVDIFVLCLIIFNSVILISHLINFQIETFPKTILFLSILSFFVYQFLSNTKNKGGIFNIILLSGLFFAVVYLIYYWDKLFPLNFGYGNRLGRFFDNQNEISKEFGFFAAISFGILISNLKKVIAVILSSASLFLFLFLILTTGSISNLLTLVLVCFISALFICKTKKMRIISIVSFIVLIVVFILLLQLPMLSYFKTRIINIFSTFFTNDSNYDSSAVTRFEIAFVSFRVGFDRILFGHGFMIATSFTPSNYQAHNNFIELFIDFGFLGFLIFEFMLLLPFIANKNKSKNQCCVVLLLYVFVFQLFLTLYYKKFEYIILPACFAFLDEKTLSFNHVGFRFNKQKCTFTKDYADIKILEIIPSLSPVGGAEVFVKNLILGIKKRTQRTDNIMLVLLYETDISHIEQELVNNNIKIIKLKKKNGLDISCAIKLRKIINSFEPDVIHTHLDSLLTLKIALLFKRKKPSCFHTIHQNFPKKRDFNNYLMAYLFRNRFVIPIAVASDPAKNFGNEFDLDIEYINNGIDLTLYDSTKPLRIRTMDFICVGRFVDVKNQIHLIKVVDSFLSKENYSFFFFGDGPTLPFCKKYVMDRRIKNIYFKGFVENINEYMSDSKILVMPSKNEGNPMVINEALASGMLVVGSDVGGIHNLLENNKNGFLFPLDDDFAFAKALKQAIRQANDQGFYPIEFSKYSIDNTTIQYLETFRREIKNEL